MKRILASLFLVGTLLAATAGTALAHPWAGHSGHFHPQFAACTPTHDHHKCPGGH